MADELPPLPEGFVLQTAPSLGDGNSLPPLPEGFVLQQPTTPTAQAERPVWKDMAVSAADTITFGLGDEAAAGVRSLLPGYGSYDQELEAIRGGQKQFAENHPYLDATAKVAGGIATLPFAGAGAARAGTLAGKAGIAAGEGAAYGAAYGFGSGEDSLDNRVREAGKGALVGAATGAAVPIAGAGLRSAGEKLTKGGQALNRASAGARSSDYALTAQDLQMIELPDGDLGSYFRSSLDNLLEDGTLGTSRNGPKMAATAAKEQHKLGKEVSDIITTYEKTVDAPVYPDFTRTEEMIRAGQVGADRIDYFLGKLDKLKEDIAKKGEGSLAFLQQQKIAKGRDWSTADSDLNLFNRAVYSDLKDAIESVVPEVGPLNEKLRQLKTVERMIRRSVGRDESDNAVKSLLALTRTSGGVGVPALLTYGAGGGPIGTTLAGAAGYFAMNPSGQAQLARGASALGKGATALANSPAAGQLAAGAARGATAAILPTGEQEQQRPLSPRTRESRTSFPSSDSQAGRPLLNTTPPRGANTTRTSVGNDLSRSSQNLTYSRVINQAVPNLPPRMAKLVDAIIHVESRGNPKAVSKKGARGLMQLMPPNIAAFGVQDPFDPVQNVRGGVALLGEEIERFGGDERLAAAAFNAGSPAVMRAIRRAGGRPSYDRIKRYLPSETQAYVRQITARLGA